MNEVLIRDYRKKSNLDWFNDNYFIAIYDQNDNNIMSFEDIETPVKVFNITLQRLLDKIRNNLGIEYKGHKLKIYVFEKEKEIENVRRR